MARRGGDERAAAALVDGGAAAAAATGGVGGSVAPLARELGGASDLLITPSPGAPLSLCLCLVDYVWVRRCARCCCFFLVLLCGAVGVVGWVWWVKQTLKLFPKNNSQTRKFEIQSYRYHRKLQFFV